MGMCVYVRGLRESFSGLFEGKPKGNIACTFLGPPILKHAHVRVVVDSSGDGFLVASLRQMQLCVCIGK